MLLLAAIITGLVVDPSDARVAGSSVELRPSPGADPIATVQADGEGRFTLPDLAPGQYHLRITHAGFQALRIGPIALAEGETKRLPHSMLRLSRKEDFFYCNMKFAAPRYKTAPSPQSLLRGNATAATRQFTATVKPDANFEIKRLTIPAKTAIEIEGSIDTPECPGPEPCPVQRKVLRDDERVKYVICL